MRVAMAFAVLLAATAAFANPIAFDMYIDFDPPNHVHSVYPAPYTTVNAHVVLENYLPWDIYAVFFDVDMMFGDALITGSFVPATPVYTVQIVDNGITIIAEDCISEFPATLGYVPVFYTGAPDCVQIHPHVDNGNTIVMCDTMEDYQYCYVLDGGIGMEPQELRELCGNPVQDIAWGAIKSLYR